jgi:hypothetical protein
MSHCQITLYSPPAPPTAGRIPYRRRCLLAKAAVPVAEGPARSMARVRAAPVVGMIFLAAIGYIEHVYGADTCPN